MIPALQYPSHQVLTQVIGTSLCNNGFIGEFGGNVENLSQKYSNGGGNARKLSGYHE